MSKVLRLVRDTRPQPPEDLHPLGFEPAIELSDWVRRTFIEGGAPLENPTHAHLSKADVAFLWTDVGNARAGRSVLGEAQLMPPMAMGKWAKARAEWQLMEWFGDLPHFLITISAAYARFCDDASFCALIEHELSHCGQAVDEYGMPKFSRQTGEPVFAMKGHDVEEFVGVVERYGARATGVEELVRVANAGPTIGAASIAMACGTCAVKRRA